PAAARLAYTADVAGNRVIDFSHAGYEGGGKPIPFVPAKIVVEPSADGSSDRLRIQAALDFVAAMPRDPATGFRGAVLLRPGRYRIDSQLRLNASGVVLRGSGQGGTAHDTVLVATGTSRRTLIEIGGTDNRIELPDTRRAIRDAYVPVDATSFNVGSTAHLSVGDRIIVHRPSTAEWISLLGMDTFPGWRAEGRLHWKPGSRDLEWDRTLTAIEGDRITIDAPLTTAIDRAYGGGSIYRYDFPGRIDHVGIENLRCVSEHLNDTAPAHPLAAPAVNLEEHAWVCVSLDNVENAWIRQLTARHFVSYVVKTGAASRAITIEDCIAEDPVSEIASYRRRVFSIGGQLTLVQRCESMQGRRDFTTGFTAAGPNVFLHCTARDALDYSGPVESWASGVLYDNVTIRGNALRLLNHGIDGQGAGWAAANSILWNCDATDIQVQSAPGAPNQAYGCKGDVTDDSLIYDPARIPYRGFVRGMPTQPASLYLAQLAERRGAETTARTEISLAADHATLLKPSDISGELPAPAPHPLRIENARFTIDGHPAFTETVNYSWYQAQMPPKLARTYGPALTRFAPGESSPGLTDNLAELAAAMPPRAAFVQHYGLWYDRRRVNHNFSGAPEHRDANVWAPFMEMPWARSAQGRDWNGLSKYDLARFNPWYFSRLKEFADLADARGLVLYNYFYFQHALQETRAHYVDFPWRPVNCIQKTDLPDENPAASAFYDIAHPVRRELHRLYLRHTLDVLGANTNVVFGLDREYTGPLSFVEFVLDTIAEWQSEHDRKIHLALEIPKDQLDALLADPQRAPLISAIAFHHWFYRADGSLYAAIGGINKAPREQSPGIVTEADLATLRTQITNPVHFGANIVSSPEFQRLAATVRASTPAMRYRALREYRDAFPHLVILQVDDDFPALTAAIEKQIPSTLRAQTRPAALLRNHRDSAWCMAAPGRAYLIYSMAGEAVDLDLSADTGVFNLTWLDSDTGELVAASAPITAGAALTLTPPETNTHRPWIAWLVP
ncbi:MAG TPA: DUF6298 domain-containing protein, partial [Opitutus sp.]|nr:DUF6298 domain-containing protein [Opitutus sp.]